MKCKYCDNERMAKSVYCPVCANLVEHQREGRARGVALMNAKGEGGFYCGYSHVRMDLKDPSSPYYINFDHREPGVLNDLVACIAVVNFSKANMTSDEFPHVVHETVHHWDTGEPFDRDIVPFRCWQKGTKADVKAGRWSPPVQAFRVPPLQVRKIDGELLALDGFARNVAATIMKALGAPARSCKVCKKPVGPYKMFCPRCLRLVHRASPTSKLLQAQALVEAFEPVHDGFRCHHCGVLLELEDWTSPWYLWYDHPIPRDESRVVASSALMNRMKTDTDEEEFHVYMQELDKAMHGGTFDTSALKFRYWKRHG